ncbi:MAG: GNAT family N-acetyltransferase [Mobilitalea sp.]
MEVPILETARLILRPLTTLDAEAVYQWVSDLRVTKYMPYKTYTNVEAVRNWLSSVESDDETYHFGFVLKQNNLLIGSGDIGYSSEKSAWDFGYNLRYDCWNMGFATEAAKGMIKYVYDNFGARDFSSNYAADNIASGKVMEKCGLIFDHDGEYSKLDGSKTFKARFYRAHLDEIDV